MTIKMDEVDLPEVIGDLAQLAGGRKKASEIMGVGPTTLDNYKSGKTSPKFLEVSRLLSAAKEAVESSERRNIDPTLALSLEQAFDQVVDKIRVLGFPVDPNFHHSLGRATRSAAPETGTLISIPRFDAVLSAGTSEMDLAAISPSGFLHIDRKWLWRFVPEGTQVSLVEAIGDSMEPMIQTGDLLFVRHDTKPDAVLGGGIFALTYDGGLMVKRVQPGPNRDLLIISDNPRYQPISIPRDEWDERVTVHGTVFWAGGTITGR